MFSRLNRIAIIGNTNFFIINHIKRIKIKMYKRQFIAYRFFPSLLLELLFYAVHKTLEEILSTSKCY